METNKRYSYIVSCLSGLQTKKVVELINRDAQILYSIDTRTALYNATGIAAQNGEPVIVLAESNNSSRSAFPGMTEAFYRRLPIILLTFGNQLDYTKKINDTINSHVVVSSVEDFLLIKELQYPSHVEITDVAGDYHLAESTIVQKLLSDSLNEDDYLYIGQGINKEDYNWKCKVVNGGTIGCVDGAIANVLGASLAKKRKRYVALISELEAVHDINTLGNININDSIKIVVLGDKWNDVLLSVGKSLRFCVTDVSEDVLTLNDVELFISSPQKSILVVK